MSQDHAPFRVGLLGHGTVGSAVAELLPERAEAIEHVAGRRPEISGVLTRSRGDAHAIIDGSDLVVEVLGGLEPARELVTAALSRGRHVVTANKQLLAEHGEELWGIAREHGVQLRFEAAVAGVVPVIRVLQETLAGQRIDRLHGIVNGTTNFILTRMASTGASYVEALAEAQALGYAEADPSDDVSGKDAAAKLAILARLAFDTPVHLSDVPYDGVEHVTAEDIAYAAELGLSLRLIGTAERVGEELSARVHPAFLSAGHPLASVEGSFNAVTIESPAITEITLSGPGAGGPQTASAVIGDVISAMIPPAQTPAAAPAPRVPRRRRGQLLPPRRRRRRARGPRPDRPDPRAAGRLGEERGAEGHRGRRPHRPRRPSGARVALLRRRAAHRQQGLRARHTARRSA